MKTKVKLLFSIIIITCLLASCGKDVSIELSKEEISKYEHVFSNVSPENLKEEIEYDSEGNVITNDTVYVSSENAILRSTPSSESEAVETINYGTELSRASYNDNGYSKIMYNEQEVYILTKNITILKIDKSKEFNYNVAALNIVDTSRQFYTYDDMCEDIRLIKEQFPQCVSVNVIGISSDNRSIFDVIVGNPESENKILLVGGMIGCEYMTSMVLTKFIEYYAHYTAEGYYNGYSYNDLLKNCAIHIIPMFNPDGIAISQFYLDAVKTKTYYDNINQWFERDQSNGGTSLSLDNYLMFYDSNVRGVNLAMNFPYNWDEVGGNTYPGSKDFKGDSAGSENETKAMLKLVEKIRPSLVINYRTTGSSFSYNYGQDEELLEDCKNIADRLASVSSYTVDEFKFYKDGYGSLEGYLNSTLQIPCVKMNIGNGSAPLSLNEYNTIWNSARETVAEAITLVINKKY